MRIVVAVTGASGACLARETLRQLKDAGVEVHLVVSASARITIAHELGPDGLGHFAAAATVVHDPADIAAPIASGSFPVDAMAVVPCSMRSLSAIAHGVGEGLIARAADVTLKERRRLVLVPREAPLTEIHLGSMLTLARMGVVIAPPVPPFYAAPQTIDEMVREIAARLVGWLGVDPGPAMTRWGAAGTLPRDPAVPNGPEGCAAPRTAPSR